MGIIRPCCCHRSGRPRARLLHLLLLHVPHSIPAFITNAQTSRPHAFIPMFKCTGTPTELPRLRASLKAPAEVNEVNKNSPLQACSTGVGASMLLWSATMLNLVRSPSPAVAASVDNLPQEISSGLTGLRQAEEQEDPGRILNAIKDLSGLSGLDELTFDKQARETVNTELKVLQRSRPDLWDSESSYYGGVVRRAVDPFYVIELSPWLKVAPLVGGLGYLLAILVQRKVPRLFAVAYFGALAAVVGPAVFLILR